MTRYCVLVSIGFTVVWMLAIWVLLQMTVMASLPSSEQAVQPYVQILLVILAFVTHVVVAGVALYLEDRERKKTPGTAGDFEKLHVVPVMFLPLLGFILWCEACRETQEWKEKHST